MGAEEAVVEWEDDWGRGRGGRTAVAREGRMVKAEWATKKERGFQEVESKEAHVSAVYQKQANTQAHSVPLCKAPPSFLLPPVNPSQHHQAGRASFWYFLSLCSAIYIISCSEMSLW